MSRPRVQASPSQVVMALVDLPGWRLFGEGDQIAIEKDWRFVTHAQALLFVNALGWLAESLNHHPEVVLNHAHCVVRWRTHDVQGLSTLDFDAAQRTNALPGAQA
jgi:4a-hydroxytetrahydrobiopterin dehydratase